MNFAEPYGVLPILLTSTKSFLNQWKFYTQVFFFQENFGVFFCYHAAMAADIFKVIRPYVEVFVTSMQWYVQETTRRLS